jgi:hypothetical protein
MFIAHAVLLIITNGIFCIFAKSKPEKWTKTTNERRKATAIVLNVLENK